MNKTVATTITAILFAFTAQANQVINERTTIEDDSVFSSPPKEAFMDRAIRQNVAKTKKAINASDWSKKEKRAASKLPKGLGKLLDNGTQINGLHIENHTVGGDSGSDNAVFYSGTYERNGIRYCWKAVFGFVSEPFYIVEFEIRICGRQPFAPITPTPTPNETPTPQPTVSPTPSITPSPTSSPVPTPTPTVPPSPTPSPTPIITPTPTPSATPTPTATPSATPTPTPTATPTPSATPTVTPTPTPTPTPGGCTLTQGYWKNHPEAWTVTELDLGNVTYDQSELLQILNEPVNGNGLVALAHQLIAAKLNVENDAPHDCIDQAIADADAMIGNLVIPPIGNGFLPPEDVSNLVFLLDQYNNGLSGCAPHCNDTEPGVPPYLSPWTP